MPEVAAPPAVPVELAPVVPAAPPADITSPPPVTTPAETPTPAGAEQPVPPTAAATAVPPAAPVVPPAPEPTPVVPPQVQEYISRLEDQNARAETQQEQQDLRDWVSRRATQLENAQGFTAEQAQAVAQQQADVAYRAFRGERFLKGQMRAAVAIGRQYGVDPDTLMDLPTPQAMEQVAAQAKAQGSIASELARLKAENEALKKGRVPPTTYAAPGVAATPAPGDYVQKLKSGGPLPTAAEIDAYVRSKYMAGSA